MVSSGYSTSELSANLIILSRSSALPSRQAATAKPINRTIVPLFWHLFSDISHLAFSPPRHRLIDDALLGVGLGACLPALERQTLKRGNRLR